jgi:DNA-binding response OmpR family regulator
VTTGLTGNALDLPDPCAAAKRVLLIEDNLDLRDLIQISLEIAGHEVFVAGDGRRGVEAALECDPDVIVVDIGLPLLDGYEVARAIRGNHGSGPLLIAMTGYGRDEDEARITEVGFDQHLVKPVPPLRLLDLVGRHPRRDRQAGAASTSSSS